MDFGSLLVGPARKEMRDRTDRILAIQESLRKSLIENTRALRKLLESSGIDSKLKDEFRSSMQVIVQAEKELQQAMVEHITTLESIISQLA